MGAVNMAIFVQWKKAVSGNFSLSTNWLPAGVPGSIDDVELIVPGAAYTVTDNVLDAIVDALEMNANATLTVGAAAGDFTVDTALINAGKINVAATAATPAALNLGTDGEHFFEFYNSGVVTVAGSTQAATLNFNASYTRLDGGGIVNLSGGASGAQAVLGSDASGPVLLENSNETIEGAGVIGNNDTMLQNDVLGKIVANAAKAMTIASAAGGDPNIGVENDGVIETTGAGGLRFVNLNSNLIGEVEDNGNLIADGTGALTLDNFAIAGAGAVEATKAGASIVLDGANLDSAFTSTILGSSIKTAADTFNAIESSVANAGSIIVADGSTLAVGGQGLIDNTGTITLDAVTATTTLMIASAGLEGTGNLVLSDNLGNSIVGDGVAGSTFTNYGKVSGSGTIAGGSAALGFVNIAGAVVNSNGTKGLTIIAKGGGTDSNEGLVETTGTGGLTIESTTAVAVAFSNAGVLDAIGKGALNLDEVELNTAGGLVETTKAGASINLDNATLSGGVTSIIAGSTLVAQGASVIEEAVSNAGTIDVTGVGASLVASGQWLNTHIIDVASGGQLEVEANESLNLAGGGTVELGATIGSDKTGSDATLTNVNDTIVAAGGASSLLLIGDSDTLLNNDAHGTIDANSSAASGLQIETASSAGSFYNAGLVESTAAGGLTIDDGIISDGELLASVGTIDIGGAATGHGVAAISKSGEIEFSGAASSSLNTVFDFGATGTLRLDHSATEAYGGSITGFAVGDSIDLADVKFTGGTQGAAATYTPDFGGFTGSLVVSDGTDASLLVLIGNYSADTFNVTSDGSGNGTLVTLAHKTA
jgi:hypothetical protein